MTHARKRGIAVAVAAAAVTAWYAVRIDGALRPAAPAVSVALPGTSLVTPAVYRGEDDANAVYVVYADLDGAPRTDGRFDATRVDVRTGAHSPAVIAIGPRSGFSPFLEADARIEVEGLSLRRPTFYLFRLPDGRGPGIHLVDSDTGVAKLNAGGRTLVTRRVFNSSKVRELRSLVSTDANGTTIAVVAQSPSGWTLHLFQKLPEES